MEGNIKDTDNLVDILKRFIEVSKKGYFELKINDKSLSPMERQLVDMLNEGIHNYNFLIEKQSEKFDEIIEKEEELNLMLDSSPLSCQLWDQNLNIFACNEACVKLYGFENKQEFMNRFSEFLPAYQPNGETSNEQVKKYVQEALDKGSCVFDWTHLRTNGETLPTKVSLMRVKYGNGYAVVWYTQDMREHIKLMEGINYRNKLLQTINESASMLLQSEPEQFDSALNKSMKIMAKAVDVDRAYIWKNHVKNNELCATQVYEWSDGVESQQDNEYTVDIPYSEGMPEMLEFANGKSMNGPIRNMSEDTYQHLLAQGIKSILIVPIFLKDQFWGFMGFDDCHNERTFTEEEEAILRLGSLQVASALNIRQSSIKLNEQLTQQQLMANIFKSFITKGTMSNSIQNALAQVGIFINADSVVVTEFDKDSNIDKPSYYWCADPKYIPNLLQKELSEIVRGDFPQFHDETEDNLGIYCGNTLTQENEKIKNLYEKAGLKSFACAPIYVEGKLWGDIRIENHEACRKWSESDIVLVNTISSAISNAVIRDMMEKERAEALNKAVQASKAKSDFLSNMSHEIRTPMNAVMGMTEIGKDSKTIEGKDKAFQKIGDASEHLLNVINDILDMSKIEANKLELSPINFDFRKTLQRTVDIIDFRTKDLKQKLDVNIDENIPLALIGDEHRIAQVITNLLSNAVKFTPKGGKISIDAKLVSTEEESNLCNLQISVNDTGIGVTEEQKSRIFEAFEQAESGTARKYGGTGLGLPICKRIVEMMGGKIWIESEPGKGSTFYCKLPLQKGNEIDLDKSSQEENMRSDFTGHTILIAEDVDINCEIIDAMLEKTNICMEFVENGIEVVSRFSENPDKYDLIFMDVQMPKMDGLEATRRIRNLGIPRAKTIPIIAMTANAFDEDKKSSTDAGMNDHINKPINYNCVLGVLREYLKEVDNQKEDDEKSISTESTDLVQSHSNAKSESGTLISEEKGKPSYVVFRIQDDKYAVNVQCVKRICELNRDKIISSDNKVRYVIGQIPFDGKMISVAETSSMVGNDTPIEENKREHVIIISTDKGTIGMAVDEALSVEQLDDKSSVQDISPFVSKFYKSHQGIYHEKSSDDNIR